MTATTLERPLRHDKTVTMRMPAQTKELIETAATAVNKSFSAFVTESARTHAIDVLLDQAVFHLSSDEAEAWERILLDPPAPNDRLRDLMEMKAPWER